MDTANSPVRVGLTFNVKRVDPKSGNDVHAEFDSVDTIRAIANALESLGHQVVELEATPELARTLDPQHIDVVFNIAEGFRGRNREAQVPALLELLGIPYTGSDPTTLCVTLDKGLAKRIVRAADVSTAMAHVVGPHDRTPAGLRFPVIVKPNAEGSSKGIGRASVARNELELIDALVLHYRSYTSLALVEEYLPGREFTVAILGDDALQVLPIMEIVFDDESGDLPVYSYGHKIETESGVRFECPAEIDGDLEARIRQVAVDSFRALGCRDVARIDVRCDADGNPNFIECNPLPGLSPGFSDLCIIAERAGLEYADLIGAILAPALARIES